MRILVVAKNRKKNRKNVRTTVARGARMNLIAKNAPKQHLCLGISDSRILQELAAETLIPRREPLLIGCRTITHSCAQEVSQLAGPCFRQARGDRI